MSRRLTLALVWAVSAGALAAAPSAKVDVAVCAACHGPTGQGVAAMPTSPYLAGLPGPYMERQLRDLADGARRSPVMSVLAQALTPAKREVLARYFASLPRRGGPASGTPTPSALGRRLAEHGLWSRGVPACVLCHGRDGIGVGSDFPALAGQPSVYLANQLRAFKTGARSEGPLGLMKAVASRLSERDIEAVAGYFASLSPVPGPYRPPGLEGLPAGPFGQAVEEGLRVFEDPSRYAGAYVGNRLRCSNCHLDAGRLAGSAPMWAAFVSFPAYRSKTRRVNTFAERLQGCFRYSMNGKAPPLGDPVLVALESYSYWLARGMRVDPHLAGRGYPKLPKPASPPDYQRGERVYAEHCALCHASGGAGQTAVDGSAAFPALWGRGSFNWGAGMASLGNAAPFIKANMPLGLGGTLTLQQAWDVALYVDAHERPQDPRFTGSVAETRKRYHDSPLSMYGQVVDGYLLGSERHDR